MQMQKDVHLTGKDLTQMVQLRPQDVGKYAIVPGPKDRLDVLMKKIENPVKNFSFMEYTMYTGTYEGIRSQVSTAEDSQPIPRLQPRLCATAG